METTEWTPADLLQMSGGYWSACALHAAVKLNLFTPLAEKSCTAETLAEELQVDERGVAMLLNAVSAMGLLNKVGESYCVTEFSKEFLSRSSRKYLGHIIMHHHHLMASWAFLDEAVKSGEPLRERASHGDDAEWRESFELGMLNLAMLIAPKIVANIDLKGRKRMLDLGGGPGTYAIHFCQQNPELTAVVFDLSTTRPFAEQTIKRFGLSDRITFQAGDFDIEEVPGQYDVAWLSHILHGCGPEGCAVMLRKAFAALEPGGLIMVQEFILDDSFDGPLFPALFSLNMLVGTPAGQSYSEGQLIKMLSTVGAVNVKRLDIVLPNGAGVIVGEKKG